jgi:hypothetical protein
LVEMKSKRVLGFINTETAYSNLSKLDPLHHGGRPAILPSFWQVEGKWGMDIQMLVRLKDSEIDWDLT